MDLCARAVSQTSVAGSAENGRWPTKVGELRQSHRKGLLCRQVILEHFLLHFVFFDSSFLSRCRPSDDTATSYFPELKISSNWPFQFFSSTTLAGTVPHPVVVRKRVHPFVPPPPLPSPFSLCRDCSSPFVSCSFSVCVSRVSCLALLCVNVLWPSADFDFDVLFVDAFPQCVQLCLNTICHNDA